MKNNLISVVIPVYNGEEYIERCVQSVLNQENVNLITEYENKSINKSYLGSIS